MIAGFAFAISFLVQPLSDPGRYPVLATQRSASIARSGRPSTVMISRNGRVVVGAVDVEAENKQRILVVTRGGTRQLLDGPAPSALAKVFFTYRPGFPDLSIGGVTVSNDAMIYSTVMNAFGGAYSGIEEVVFSRKAQVWQPISSVRDGSSNASVVAVDNGTILWATDSLDASPAAISRMKPNAAFQGSVVLQRGLTRSVIGNGIPTALRDGAVCGTQLDANGHVSSVIWTKTSRVRLGDGIGWDLNGSGYVVGDDRSEASSYGRPTLWVQGKQSRLSDRPGSAFGTSQDGMIVGSIDDDGFYIAPGDPRRQLVLIDRSVRSAGWHVSAAFGVSDDHRIIALASHGHSGPQVVLLVPEHPHRAER